MLIWYCLYSVSVVKPPILRMSDHNIRPEQPNAMLHLHSHNPQVLPTKRYASNDLMIQCMQSKELQNMI